MFSDSDMATAGDSLGLAVVDVVMTSDTRAGLAATATVDLTGSADVILPSAACSQVDTAIGCN